MERNCEGGKQRWFKENPQAMQEQAEELETGLQRVKSKEQKKRSLLKEAPFTTS